MCRDVFLTRMDPSLETGLLSQSKIELQCSSHCWICEGWTQVKFEFDPTQSTLEHKLPVGPDDKVTIHFDFEHYSQEFMEKESSGIYAVY